MNKTYIPRGIRNNNPLNIIKSSVAWRGEIAGDDKTFCVFKTMGFGIRAAIINSHTQIKRIKKQKGRCTIVDFIQRWCPESDKQVKSYVDTVCRETGFDMNDEVALSNEEHFCNLLQAMAFVETGVRLDLKGFTLAYDMLSDPTDDYSFIFRDDTYGENGHRS